MHQEVIVAPPTTAPQQWLSERREVSTISTVDLAVPSPTQQAQAQAQAASGPRGAASSSAAAPAAYVERGSPRGAAPAAYMKKERGAKRTPREPRSVSTKRARTPAEEDEAIEWKEINDLLHGRGPLAEEAKTQRPHELVRTAHRQIFVERPRVRRRPSGDKWLNRLLDQLRDRAAQALRKVCSAGSGAAD